MGRKIPDKGYISTIININILVQMCTAFRQLVQIIITLSTNDDDDDQGRISHIGFLSYSLGRQEQRGGSAVNFLSLTIVAIE